MGTLHEVNPSLWVGTTPDAGSRPPLAGPVTVDVAVIGAGITGLTAAALLQDDGASVVVLEAGAVCSGVTAYTTAKVTSLHGLVYAGLAGSAGDDVARLYGEANQAAVERVATFVEERGIDCDFSRRSAYTYTTDPGQVKQVEAEVEVARRLGLPAELTTETELPFDVAAAVRLDDQAQFHPRRYCRGLAGPVAVHEHTRALGVDEGGGGPCTVSTDRGEVRAGHVVVATHLPFLDRGGFFAKCHPTRSYALAARLDGPVPRGMYLGIDRPTRSVRAAQGDGLVILGGEGHKVGQDDDTRRRHAALEEWARATFPVASVEYRWSAQDLVPVDGRPFVGPQLPGSRVLVATGFKKWGMTNGTAAAMILADLVAGRDNPWTAAFDATRIRETVTRDLVKENLDVGKRFVGDRLRTLLPPDAEHLRPGEGGIARLGGEKVAAYRDDEGRLHAVSPVCTHLGCLVSFNTAERTWDCPCHGSRYTVEGRVIEGPATKDLRPAGEAGGPGGRAAGAAGPSGEE